MVSFKLDEYCTKWPRISQLVFYKTKLTMNLICSFCSCPTNQSARFRKGKTTKSSTTNQGGRSPTNRLRFAVWFCLPSAGRGALSDTANEKRCKVGQRRKYRSQRQHQCCFKTTGARKHHRDRRAPVVYVDPLGEERSPLCRAVAFRPSDSPAGELGQDLRD